MTPSRIEENFKIWDFKLTDEDMKSFDEMNVGWRHLIWAECSMHPDFPFKVEYFFKIDTLNFELACSIESSLRRLPTL